MAKMNKIMAELRHISPLLAFLLLTSCNLFIDDEFDEVANFQNVPVHTGEGYDKPVTVSTDSCTVTYQYKSNVRVLSQEDQNHYIVSTRMDEVGAFIEIHYRGDTPKEQLPVPGEILMSGVTQHFPWGCNHQVVKRYKEGNEYIMVAGFMTLEDSYEELQIDGKMTTVTDEKCYVEAIPDRVDDEDAGSGEASSRPQRDAGEVTTDKISMETVDMDDGFGFVSRLSLSIKRNFGNFYGQIYMPAETNFIRETMEFDFSGFSIREGNYKCKLIETYEEQFDIRLTGGYSGKVFSKRFQPIRSKVLVFGPVVLVLFVNIDFDFNVDLSISAVFSKHRKTETTYCVNLRKLTKEKEIVKHLINEDWKTEESFVFEGKISFEPSIMFGLGIYGKIISARFIFGLEVYVKAIAAGSIELSDGKKIQDLQAMPGIEIGININLTLGVFLDLSLKGILGAFMDDEDIKKLENYVDQIEKSSQYYQDICDSDPKAFDATKDYYKKKGKKEKAEKALIEAEQGLSETWTFNIWKVSMPWYPTIKDDLKVTTKWNEYRDELMFLAEFTIDKAGFFAGMGQRFTPCLQLTNSKDGNNKAVYVWSEEGKKDGKVQSGKTYHFTIPDMKDDLIYDIAPCYYPHPVSTSTPVALDKALPFSFTSPTVSVTNAKPLNLQITNDPRGYDVDLIDGSYPKYEYRWEVATFTTVKGMDHIKDWYVQEGYTRHDSKSLDLYNGGDGTFEHIFTFIVYTNKKWGNDRFLMLSFSPYFILKDSGAKKEGKTFQMNVYANHRYSWGANVDIEGDNKWGKYRPSVSIQPDVMLEPGERIVTRLDAIKKDGKIIWQSDDYQEAPVQSFEGIRPI